jgi:hypothetical protein
MPSVDPLAPAPAPAPAPAEAPMTAAQADRLINTIEGWSSKVVKAIPTSAPAPTPHPAPADDDALTVIASNGWKPVDDRVAGMVRQTIQDTLAPYLGAQAGDAATANENAVRTQIDSEFGEGTYNSDFKNRVDELFGDRTVDRAIRAQFDRAVQLVRGEKFEALADKRAAAKAAQTAAAEEAKRMARTAPFMPGRGGFYSPEAELQLSDEEREQLKKTKEVTGWAPSEEDAAKMRNLVMGKRGGGLTLDDFNKAFPLPKS